MEVGIAIPLSKPDLTWLPETVRVWFGTSDSNDEAQLLQFLLDQRLSNPIGIATMSYAMLAGNLLQNFQTVIKIYTGSKFSLGIGDKSRMKAKQIVPTLKDLFQAVQSFSEVKYLASSSPRAYQFASENELGIIANSGDPEEIRTIKDKFNVKAVIAYLPLRLPDFTPVQLEQFERWVGRMASTQERDRTEVDLNGLMQRLEELESAGAEETIISTSWTPKGREQVISLLT